MTSTGSGRGPFLKIFKTHFTCLFVESMLSSFFENFWPNRTCRIRTSSPTVIYGSDLVKIWHLTSPCGVKFNKFSKMPSRGCLQGQVACSCLFLSISNKPGPNDKPKSDFWVKFGQNLTFDLSLWGQILWNFKYSFAGLFVGSIFLFV